MPQQRRNLYENLVSVASDISTIPASNTSENAKTETGGSFNSLASRTPKPLCFRGPASTSSRTPKTASTNSSQTRTRPLETRMSTWIEATRSQGTCVAAAMARSSDAKVGAARSVLASSNLTGDLRRATETALGCSSQFYTIKWQRFKLLSIYQESQAQRHYVAAFTKGDDQPELAQRLAGQQSCIRKISAELLHSLSRPNLRA